ncbi:MAG: segregation/condensation protein A [Syntrophales bacterium]|jgi:segregation and condensation protein A|nr:segregation/condensation protein A [Syntrophales bacterium]MDY0044990.1 segregation/condensation protein A [Syntrophales bacterium]
MAYQIKLDVFEGPLDLLLYLIRKHEIDIYDIPISLITSQYMAYIEEMKSLNLDLAGEYLLIAATLLHIKSRMLIPAHEEEEAEEEDPRAELVKQLVEYRTFKEAALNLGAVKLLGRDVFARNMVDEACSGGSDRPIREIGIFDLVEAFRNVLAFAGEDIEMEVDLEKFSLSQRINEIMEELNQRKAVTFEELLGTKRNRKGIIYTFLALLELMKLRMARAFQADSYGPIRIFLAVEEEK